MTPTTATNSVAIQAAQQFTPLELETRPTVDTAAAAHYLHLAQQTLRIYACRESGPLHPRRINGRLHWPESVTS